MPVCRISKGMINEYSEKINAIAARLYVPTVSHDCTFFNVVSICNIIFKENYVPVGVHFMLHLACADYWIHVLCLSTSFTLIFGEVLVAGKAFLLLPSPSYFMSVKTVY